MRKLASIQKVLEIIPVKGAERIEIAKVLGWTLMVEKNQFQPHDLAIMIEVDSILPERPEFEFMRKHKFRVKAMRSNRLGIVSQGLLVPLTILPAGSYNEGDDVTELLGIQKYEHPIQDGRNTKPKGLFPTHLIPKTDEIRIQSLPSLLDELRGLPYVITTKLDGTSFTCYYWRGEFGVCSRNLELRDDGTDVYWAMARKHNLPTKLKDYCEITGMNLGIQGEICGRLIAQNPLGLSNDDLFIFQIFDIDNRTYLNYDVAMNIAKDLGLKFVPIDSKGYVFNFSIDELLEKAKGKYSSGKNREGIVIRPQKTTYSPTISNQLSFKVINTDYLLEEK